VINVLKASALQGEESVYVTETISIAAVERFSSVQCVWEIVNTCTKCN